MNAEQHVEPDLRFDGLLRSGAEQPVTWIASLHAAAGVRWMSANPANLEEAIASFGVAMGLCRLALRSRHGVADEGTA